MLLDKKIQKRDLEALDFINKCKLCTRRQIQEIIFPDVNQNVCMRRLKLLDDLKLISRARYNIDDKSNQYVYYPYKSKKPSKRLLQHDLVVSEFIKKLYLAHIEVVDVERSVPIGSVIPDAVITIRCSSGGIKRLVLEVQLSGKLENCITKYSKFKNEIKDNRRNWNTMPSLIVISELEGKRINKVGGMKVLYSNINIENIRELVFNKEG